MYFRTAKCAGSTVLLTLVPDKGYRCGNDWVVVTSVDIMIGGDYAGEVRSVDQLGRIR